MSLTLYVDGARFRAHLRSVFARHPQLVPVAKGNGYGFHNDRLALEAQSLGADTLAVGTYDELGQVSSLFRGDLLVLTPWRPFGGAVVATTDHRVIHTVGRLEDLTDLLTREPGARVVLELVTSMLRHGFSPRGLRATHEVLAAAPDAVLEGISVHLPMGGQSHVSEMHRLMTDVVAAGLGASTIWVSHLSEAELASLAAAYPDFTFRPRIGTDLWLGARDALAVKATVLDVHPVERGDVFGYRSRTAPKSGTILIVSGGTAHGIGLEAPTGAMTVKARAATLARGGLDAAGFVRSPYSIGGKQRLFAEPPHMQASMLFLPHGATVPQVGDEVDVRVRFTATAFDRIVFS
jgi:alanine racemase